MGVSGSAPDVTREAVRSIFAQLDGPSTPVTTAEIADQLECTRDAARETLEEFVDQSELRRKRIDGTTHVWWRPVSSADQQPISRSFGPS